MMQCDDVPSRIKCRRSRRATDRVGLIPDEGGSIDVFQQLVLAHAYLLALPAWMLNDRQILADERLAGSRIQLEPAKLLHGFVARRDRLDGDNRDIQLLVDNGL